MKFKSWKNILVICATLPSLIKPTLAADWSGNIALEYRGFTASALYPEQHQHYLSASVEPELYTTWDNDNQNVTFTPFIRVDQYDDEHSHADIRELAWQRVFDNWELKIGISKVFWGSTESQHLVDIINQTDAVENIDGEDKLGQPMVRVSLERDWGNLDLFLLPGFRERTFPGVEGRLRTELIVDSDLVQYESDDEDRHIDYAARWFQTLGDWDVGLSFFNGTSREPELIPTINNQAQLVLAPYYSQIIQYGLDVTASIEDWLWKIELISREINDNSYTAATGGFEYTFVGVMDSNTDLGIVAEYLFDDRDQDAATPFQNDIMLGVRLALNDEQSTEALLGIIIDADTQTTIFNIEASRRLGADWKLEAEARAFSHIDEDDLFYSYRDDSFIQFNLAYYY